MVKLLEQKKRQKILLVIGAGILIIILVILYFSFWKDGSEVSIEVESRALGQEQKASSGLEQELKKIDFDFSFLNETILPFLRIYGNIPVEKGETGRTNPFIPY